MPSMGRDRLKGVLPGAGSREPSPPSEPTTYAEVEDKEEEGNC